MAKVQKKIISTFLTALMILSLFVLVGNSSTIANAAAGDTIYFEAPSDWSTVYCYAWTPSNAEWPGETMTKVSGNIYSYTLTGAQSNIIFNNGSTQTIDLAFEGANKIFKITGESSGKKTGAWSDYSIGTSPIVKASPSTTTFTDTLTITLTATNCTSATYSINGGKAKSYSNGETITIGADVATGSTVTLKLTGTDGTNTATETYTYTKKKQAEGTIVALKNSAKWSTCYVYAWSGTNSSMKAWPGTQLTETDAEGNFILTIPEEYVGQVVFNNGSDQGKSKDLALTSGQSMIYDNSAATWTEYQTGPIRISSFTADAVSPQYTGSTIVFTAAATSTNGAVTYQFTVNNGSSTTTLSSYSTKKTATWSPTTAGTYKVTVTVKDSKGETLSKDMNFVINSSSTATEPIILGTSPANGSTIGAAGSQKTITLNTAGGKIGTNLIFVKPVIKDPNGKQLNVAYYSQSKSVSFTPTVNGDYTITFYAQNSYNTTINRTFTFTVGEGSDPDPLAISSFTASNTNVTLGDSTTLNTIATGSNLQYKYAYTTGSGWTVIKAYSTTSSYNWKPTAAGTYTVRAFVTDGTTTVKKDITVKVTKAASNLAISSIKSFSTNNTASIGDTVKFGVTATGTTSTTKYKFEYTRTGTTWATIRNYSTSRYASWTPKYAGTYTIKVTAKDGTATDTKTMTFVVNAKGTTTSITSFTSSKTSMYVLDSATLNVKATGSNLKYKFAYQYNGSWKVIQAYSTSSTCTFTPNNTGTYTVRVFVDDGTNVLRKDITITVK